jgi:NAD-dependent dihydropyrimidine dehydrogenase PreA subunit
MCRSLHDLPAFSFTGRGIDTVIHHYPLHHWEKTQCRDCQSCIEVCPVGALKLRDIA